MIQQAVLGNGVRVLTERIPHTHSVTVGFWVEAGSRHEATHQSGLSHFVEHMLFKGTKQRTAHQIAMAMNLFGGALNAFTSREYTCFYSKVLADKMDHAVELLSDLFLNSLFLPEEVERERRVILHEMDLIEETPEDEVYDHFLAKLYPYSALGRPVIGTRESVQAVTHDGLMDFVQQSYCGQRLIVAAAGRLDHEAFVALVEQRLKGLREGEKTTTETPAAISAGVDLIQRDIDQVHFCLGVPAVSQRHEARYAFHLLNQIFGGSMGSRLFQQVREKRALCYSIHSYLNLYRDTGSLSVYGAANATNLVEIVEILKDEMAKIGTSRVEKNEFIAAFEHLKGSLLLSLETTDNRMCRLAHNELLLGRQAPVDEVIERMQAVTTQQIQEVAWQYLNEDQLVGSIIGPIVDHRSDLRELFN